MAGTESGVLKTFESLVSLAGLPDDHREMLAAVPSQLAAQFARVTFRDLKNNPHGSIRLSEICERSAKSEFPLSEWITQIVKVYTWLEERRHYARLGDVVEYASCAFEGSALQPGHNLDWYLSNFGFQRCMPLSDAHNNPAS
jgi:hypothetical protein